MHQLRRSGSDQTAKSVTNIFTSREVMTSLDLDDAATFLNNLTVTPENNRKLIKIQQVQALFAQQMEA